MSLQSIVVMAGSQSLRVRFIAAAAAAGLEDPQGFVDRNMWQMVSDGGFAAAWDSATASYDPNVNPDTGQRTDVIPDSMIEDALGARIAELTAAAPDDSPDAT